MFLSTSTLRRCCNLKDGYWFAFILLQRYEGYKKVFEDIILQVQAFVDKYYVLDEISADIGAKWSTLSDLFVELTTISEQHKNMRAKFQKEIEKRKYNRIQAISPNIICSTLLSPFLEKIGQSTLPSKLVILTL